MSRSFCINFFIYNENTWKLIVEGFQAWYFYRFRSFRFFYKDYTLVSLEKMWPSRFSFLPWKASVSFLKVKFSFAKSLVLTVNLYLEKSLEANFFSFPRFSTLHPVHKVDNCFLWFIFIWLPNPMASLNIICCHLDINIR